MQFLIFGGNNKGRVTVGVWHCVHLLVKSGLSLKIEESDVNCFQALFAKMTGNNYREETKTVVRQ